jgi:hypothetical protein
MESLHHIAHDAEEKRCWLALININIHIIQVLRSGAGKQNDGDMRFDRFHFFSKLYAGGSPKHVVGYYGAHRSFRESFQCISCRGNSDHVVAIPLKHLLAQYKMSRFVFNAKYEGPRKVGLQRG